MTSELNGKRFSHTVLIDFENRARSLSTHASTSIEGNPLPLTEVRAILKSRPQNLRDTEREVLNYNTVLERLNKKIKTGSLSFNLKLVCDIQKVVTQNLIEKFRCGKIRNEAVFVNDPKSGKPVYLPPDHQDVPRLMEEFLSFVKIRRGVMDPLLLAGIFHKQFVVIHPFIDGNGRTARLLSKILLADMGLNTFNLFSFENYYNRNVTHYFQNVGVFGDYYEIFASLDFTAWLEYFTDGIIDELLRVKKELENAMAGPALILQAHHKKILKHVEQHGFITDRDYAKLTPRAKATRVIDFNQLIEMGLLERHGAGRATYYKISLLSQR